MQALLFIGFGDTDARQPDARAGIKPQSRLARRVLDLRLKPDPI